MSGLNSTRGRLLAGLVVVAGVAVIWAFGASRQEAQTRGLARGWLGGQWDVARACLVGTPIGRGEGEASIAAKLDAMLLDTLVTIESADRPPEPSQLWPMRCAPLFPSLRADRSAMRADPGDAITQLAVLVPRAQLSTSDPVPTERARERVRELAAPIARLDAAMPAGEAYDPARFGREERGAPAENVIASLGCELPPTRARSLFGRASAASDIEDELRADGRRVELSGPIGGPYRLAIMSGADVDLREVAREAGRAPRLWDDHTLLWVLSDGPRLALRAIDADADSATIDFAGGSQAEDPATRAPFDRAMACRASEGAHLLLRRGEQTLWSRWPGAGETASAPVAIELSLPEGEALTACDAQTLAVAWREGREWRGFTCAGEACAELPRFEGGADLQLAVRGRVLVVADGARSDVTFARMLAEDRRGWAAIVPVASGTLETTAGGWRIRTCAGTSLESADAERWRVVAAAPQRD